MNENKFTGKAEIYAKYRPSYPDELINWLYERTGAETVADIGAGTGIFTKCLLKKDWEITAVEPNDDMLSELTRALGNDVKIVKASAENTDLQSNCFDLITVAQAFHWFDKDKFKTECKRILKSGGFLAVVFNSRCQTDVAKERNKVCMKYCGQYHSGHVHTGYAYFDGENYLQNEYFSKCQTLKIENPYFLTKEQFIGDNLSRSYALGENDANYEGFVAELENVFNKFSQNGVVAQPYITECFLGTF